MEENYEKKEEDVRKEKYEKPEIKTYTEKDILERFKVSALTF
jgi:hypothetical protein